MATITCPDCDDPFDSLKSLYWHLRRHHQLEHDEAFEGVRGTLYWRRSEVPREDSLGDGPE